MKRLHALTLMSVAGMVWVCRADPVISNLQVRQIEGTKLVEIVYDLSDAQSSALNVSMRFYIQEAADTYTTLPAERFTGDYGQGVMPGAARQSFWDAGADCDGIYSTQIVLKVTVDNGVTTAPAGGMCLIPGGWFWMGDWYGEGWISGRPVHAVYVSDFYMGKFEVTNEEVRRVFQWAYDRGRIVITGGGYGRKYRITLPNSPVDVFPPEDFYILDNYSGSSIFLSGSSLVVPEGMEMHPCADISWFGAAAYCNFLSEIEGLQPCFNLTNWSCDFNKNGYRLPTEAEWEKAARGGLEEQRYPWSSAGGTPSLHFDGSKANYHGSGDPYESSSRRIKTTPAGYYNGSQIPAGLDMANGYGVYDMAGNVFEWCYDWYSHTYYETSPAIDPVGPPPTPGDPATNPFPTRIRRGGAWVCGNPSYWSIPASNLLRCDARFAMLPNSTSDSDGFRLARSAGVRVLGETGKASWSTSLYGPFAVDTRGASAGLVQMDSEQYWRRENSGCVTVAVSRIGGKDGAASVDFATADVAARAGVDYVAATGSLHWADGEASNKSITISFITNSIVQPRRSFDVLLRNAQTAQAGWIMTSTVTIVDCSTLNDYDGDCRSDLAIFNTADGKWYAASIERRVTVYGTAWGFPGVVPVPGDYDADNRADLAVFDPSAGLWYVKSATGEALCSGLAWGWPGAIPVPGDYDADGASDLAVFDSNTGFWYVASLSSKFKVQGSRLDVETQTLNCSAAAESPITDNRTPKTDTLSILAWGVPWGWPGAIPVSGDYDNDGASDLAVFDSNTGYWYIASLSSKFKVQGSRLDVETLNHSAAAESLKTEHCTLNTAAPRVLTWGVAWGWPGAVPVSGDYDNDGCSDLAVFDSNTGYWYITALSSKFKVQDLRLDVEILNYSAAAESPITENRTPKTDTPRILAWSVAWGWPGAQPVPGDYDGDGCADMALFDTATGKWYIRTVAGDVLCWGAQWGWAGATAVGAAR